MSTLYEIIELLCKDAGTNVTKMCKETGVGRSTLSELKAGRTKKLSFDVASKIASYFNVPLSFFEIEGHFQASDLMGKHVLLDYLKNNSQNDSPTLTQRQKHIVELFNDLSEEQQDNIIGRAEMLVELNEQEYRKEENA